MQSSNFFLTYPHCGDKQGVFDFLTKNKNTPIFCKVALEHHAGGEPHLHAIVVYGKRRDISTSRAFDHGIYHPNVAKLIHFESADNYISKEDASPLVWGAYTPRHVKSSDGKGPSRDEIMFSLYEASSTKEEFLSKVKSTMAFTYFTQYDRLLQSANAEFKAATREYVDPYPNHPWLLPGAVKKWLREEFNKPERAKALCLVGPSRFGKTTWARSLGKHIFWRQSTNLDTWDPSAKYLIIDDIDWKFLPNKKCWLTAMGDMTVTDRYRPKRDICNYKPCIYLTNNDPRDQFEPGESEYWEANMEIVILTRTMININADRMTSLDV